MTREELEKRTLEFSRNLIKVLKKLPKDVFNNKIISQLISSGTSIGANYREANAAETDKDFRHKMNLSFKESRESRYWPDLLMTANTNYKLDLLQLWQEADEFTRIFGKAVSTCRQNEKLKNAK